MTPGMLVLVAAGAGGRSLLVTADSLARQCGVSLSLVLVRNADGAGAPLVRSVAARLGAAAPGPCDAPGRTLNEAIRSSSSNWLAVVAAGLVLEPDFLAQAAALLAREPELDAVAPGVRVATADRLSVAEWGPPATNPATLLADPGRRPPVFVCRRSAWEAAGGFDEALGGLAEFEFWLRLSLGGRRLQAIAGAFVTLEVAPRTAAAAAGDETYLGHLRDVYLRHREALAGEMHDVLVAREVAFGRTRELHRDLLRRRDADLETLDRLRAEAAHHRAYLEHHDAAAVDWGDLRRIDPVSRDWGYDRGVPVDRRAIETFLAAHSSDVRGAVLEVQEDDFTRAFGGPRVEIAQVLDVDAANPRATILADLRCAPETPSGTFDCIILTQTLHVIDAPEEALRECYRLLKPGGVLLATIPAASRVCLEYGADGDFWRATPAGARRLVQSGFGPSHISCDTFGNVLTNTAFLHGLAAHELTDREHDAVDPYYPALTGVRARKAACPRRLAPRGVVLLYHRVAPGPDPQGLAIAPEEFERHLRELRARGTLLALDELLRTPPEQLPERPVALTFDDGYLDNLTMAAPLLSGAAIPATFFLTTRWMEEPGEYWWDALDRVFHGGAGLPASLEIELRGVRQTLPAVTGSDREAAHWALHDACVHAPLADRERLVAAVLAWAGSAAADRDGGAPDGRGGAAGGARRPMMEPEIRELSRIPGMSIGAHSVHHLALPDQPRDVVLADLAACRAALAAATGKPIDAFAYPYGAVDRDSASAVRRMFPWGLSCEAAAVGDSFDAARVPRLEAGRMSAASLAAEIERLFDRPEPVRVPRFTRLPR